MGNVYDFLTGGRIAVPEKTWEDREVNDAPLRTFGGLAGEINSERAVFVLPYSCPQRAEDCFEYVKQTGDIIDFISGWMTREGYKFEKGRINSGDKTRTLEYRRVA